MEIQIAIALIILLTLVFLATVDMAFSHISDVGLRRITSDDELANRKRSVNFLRDILDNRQRFRFAVSSAIQILMIAFTVLLIVILTQFTQNVTELLIYGLAIGLTATVLTRQILPRIFVRKKTERKLLVLLPAIRPIYSLVTLFAEPIAKRTRERLRQKLETTITPEDNDDKDEDNAEDFHALMEVGEAEGIIEEKDRELIETLVEFSDTRAAEIMTPRTEIIALPVESSIRQARDLIIEEKYSRIPVYRDSIDNIEGMVYVRDLMQVWSNGKENEPIDTILRDAFFVPETKTAAELLKSMQQNHVQVAIVIDEYGGVAGLVTVEDIVEEIVGEIEDEDIEEEEIIEIVDSGDGYYDVLGSTEIDKIERLFGVELEDDDYNTVAGLITTQAGYVPTESACFAFRGLSVEILRADKKRVQLVRLRKADGNELHPEDHQQVEES